MQLFTIGYAGRTLDALIASLQEHAVDRVIDVRELPLSRRRGFSKTPLANALAAVGIEYVHLRSAGNPYRHDDASLAEILARFRDHLRHDPTALTEVLDAARGRTATLLCMCERATECHRSVITSELARHVHVRIDDI